MVAVRFAYNLNLPGSFNRAQHNLTSPNSASPKEQRDRESIDTENRQLTRVGYHPRFAGTILESAIAVSSPADSS